jgi:hypothetical protein
LSEKNKKSPAVKNNPVRGFLPPLRVSLWQALYGHWTESPLPLRVELESKAIVNPERDGLNDLLRTQRLGRLTGLRLAVPPPTELDLWTVGRCGPPVLGSPAIQDLVNWACAALASPHRRLLRALDLSDNPLGTEALNTLLSCPCLRGLDRLVLRMCGLDDAAVAGIARCPYLDDLIELDLSGNPAFDLSPLLRSDVLPGLRRLVLRDSRHLSPWMRLELQSRFGPRVRF